ncbi:hypothetical protein SAMN04487967_0995 [Natronorubrum sediminis]|uniref:PRC-barrel domain-containing protein n=1 Tax=Natronorubrum sediminis TaxID=640943 RepID=A0A1H6FSK9_9EURY|nr:hypothetical protein [Natronorubrum sediminis]SEH12853.1 hypothetical protein SAMN04487967_0995 [Natronorubrum sediminis]
MSARLTPNDVGKPVENAAGERVAVVTSVDRDIAYVRPATDSLESTTSSIGWDGIVEQSHGLQSDAVREVTDDAIRLEGELPSTDDTVTPALDGGGSPDEA